MRPEIDWLDLPTAHAVSVATGKPLHVVALFGSLLEVQRRGFGASSMTFIAIDTSAFATVGVLEITVRLGTSQAPGKFELCTAPSSVPHLMQPTKSVRLTPGETATMVVDGADGARFGLAAMPGPAAAEGRGQRVPGDDHRAQQVGGR
jgi:hypothetical protein